MKQSEFRYKGKNLGIEKLELLRNIGDNIPDDDILYEIIDDNGDIIEHSDWVGEMLDFVEECKEENWHIRIIDFDTRREITKQRFIKLFGEAIFYSYLEVK